MKLPLEKSKGPWKKGRKTERDYKGFIIEKRDTDFGTSYVIGKMEDDGYGNKEFIPHDATNHLWSAKQLIDGWTNKN